MRGGNTMNYHPCQNPYVMEGMPTWQIQGNQGSMATPMPMGEMMQPPMQMMATPTMQMMNTPMMQPSQSMQMIPPPLQSNVQSEVMGQMDQLPMEQSYIENILRLNRGKLATVYMSFEGERKEFRGIVEAAGRDHIIISDPETGVRYLLLMIYLNYVTFDEEIEYSYPLTNMATYAPR